MNKEKKELPLSIEFPPDDTPAEPQNKDILDLSVEHAADIPDKHDENLRISLSDTEKEDASASPSERKIAAIADKNHPLDYTFVNEYHDNPYNNVFVASLDTITREELGNPPPKKNKDPFDVIINGVRSLIFWVAVVVFFVSGYQVVYKLYAYKQAEDIYNNVATNIFDEDHYQRDDLVKPAKKSARLQTLVPVNGTREDSDNISDFADNEEYNELFEMMKGQLAILKRKNPEVVGWIRMEGDTEINYPVVQHADNDYYLHYAYDGTYNPAGSIFLDYKNNIALSSNRHAIIYGHNMESGSPMFANLLHYREEDYLENNRFIDVYTENALYTYEVFASYECSDSLTADENHAWRMSFNYDDATFLGWIDAVCARSDIDSEIAIKASDRILTLSTCTNANNNRYVVHAVLVEEVK